MQKNTFAMFLIGMMESVFLNDKCLTIND